MAKMGHWEASARDLGHEVKKAEAEVARLQIALEGAQKPVPDGTTCSQCGRQDGLDACVSNEDWERISGEKWGGGMWCLWCMDKATQEKGLGLIKASLHFAGLSIVTDENLREELCQARAALEGAEAQDRWRGETLLELAEVVHRAEEHSGAFGTCQASPCRDMRAAIDIKPEQAREKERRNE